MCEESEPEAIDVAIDFEKLNMLPSATLITRLALAYNDVASALRLLDSKKRDSSDPYNGALTLYAVRMLFGHLTEAIPLVVTVQGTRELQPTIANLSDEGKAAYEKVRALARGGSSAEPFLERIRTLRDRLGFHYDKGEVCDTIRRMASEPASGFRRMTISNCMSYQRFWFADTVMERAICEFVWKVDHENVEDTQRDIDNIFDWCMREAAQPFLQFAGELCGMILAFDIADNVDGASRSRLS